MLRICNDKIYFLKEDILEEKFKIKPLTKGQIIISLDRLTRFKFTEDKYLRVFKDIISSNLIYPKYKKAELNSLNYEELRNLAQHIINFSLQNLSLSLTNDFTINKKLLEYEKSIFKFDKNIGGSAIQLLENKIDYKAAINLLDSTNRNAPYKNGFPLNLKWLKSLAKNNDQVADRANFGLKFPLEKIILVEGITEEILLPKFALLYGYDFDKAGINLISAGGKNQVVRLFYQFANILKIPMFVLLDRDAQENYRLILPKLRKNDKVHVLDCGEFEDVLPLTLIKRALNRFFDNENSIKLDDIRQNTPMVKILEEIFKQRGEEFKKAEFASLIAQNISGEKDLSPEIIKIITELN